MGLYAAYKLVGGIEEEAKDFSLTHRMTRCRRAWEEQTGEGAFALGGVYFQTLIRA